MSRRKFIKTSALAAGSILLAKCTNASESKNKEVLVPEAEVKTRGPIVISTWKHGLEANKAAWSV